MPTATATEVNKSEAIRQFMDKNPKMLPKEVAARLSEELDRKITPQYVSMIKSNYRKSKQKAKRKPKPKVEQMSAVEYFPGSSKSKDGNGEQWPARASNRQQGPAMRFQTSYTGDLALAESLLKAKALADECGGVANLRTILDLLDQLKS